MIHIDLVKQKTAVELCSGDNELDWYSIYLMSRCPSSSNFIYFKLLTWDVAFIFNIFVESDV